MVKNENYIVIQGWMVNELKLKGSELMIYAIIYGFSQADEQIFKGSLQYLADWTNSTKQSVINNLKLLIDKGLIGKNEKFINGVKFCEYYSKNLNGVLKKFEWGIKKSLINNIDNNINNICSSNIYDLIQENFGRLINPIEAEIISKWEDNDLTRYAIKESILNGARSIKYIDTIIHSYKAKGILTVDEAIKDKERFKNKKTDSIKPDWLDKDFSEKREYTKDWEKEIINAFEGSDR